MSSDYDKAGPLFRFKHLPQKSREIPPPWTEHTLVGEGEAREKFQSQEDSKVGGQGNFKEATFLCGVTGT